MTSEGTESGGALEEAGRGMFGVGRQSTLPSFFHGLREASPAPGKRGETYPLFFQQFPLPLRSRIQANCISTII